MAKKKSGKLVSVYYNFTIKKNISENEIS